MPPLKRPSKSIVTGLTNEKESSRRVETGRLETISMASVSRVGVMHDPEATEYLMGHAAVQVLYIRCQIIR